MPPPHRLVAGDHVLDGAGEYVAVVGQDRGEGGPVVEDELLAALRAAELLVEGVELRPQLEDAPSCAGKEKSFPSHTSSMASSPAVATSARRSRGRGWGSSEGGEWGYWARVLSFSELPAGE